MSLSLRTLAVSAAAVTLAFAPALSFAAASPLAAPQIAEDAKGKMSDRNIHDKRVQLENIIDQLQKDEADYGGHRALAIASLKEADAHLTQAEDYAKAHK